MGPSRVETHKGVVVLCSYDTVNHISCNNDKDTQTEERDSTQGTPFLKSQVET